LRSEFQFYYPIALAILVCLWSLITNGLAAMRLFVIARQLDMVVASEAGHLTGDLRIITDSAPGLLLNLSAARVAVMIVSIIVAYSYEQERNT